MPDNKISKIKASDGNIYEVSDVKPATNSADPEIRFAYFLTNGEVVFGHHFNILEYDGKPIDQNDGKPNPVASGH